MKKYLLLITLALIVAPLVAAGCVSPSSPSPSPTATPSTSTATATVSTSAASPSAAASASPISSPTAAATARPQTYSISLVNYAFQPSSMTIPRGSTVTWTNNAQTVHTVTSDTGVWDSGNVNPGQSYSHTFNDAGTFPYHCNYHASMGMRGTITVQ